MSSKSRVKNTPHTCQLQYMDVLKALFDEPFRRISQLSSHSYGWLRVIDMILPRGPEYQIFTQF